MLQVHEKIAVDPQRFRAAMGRFATGVTIVTSLYEGNPVGMTVNAFTSVSLSPCLLLVCLRHGSVTGTSIRTHGAFGINLLAEHQEGLALRFARSSGDRFRDMPFEITDMKVPILAECAAYFVCNVHTIHAAGDHDIVIGEVGALGHQDETRPLVYFGGGFGSYRPRMA